MNKLHYVMLGGIMALSLAACKTAGTDTMSGSTTGTTGTWGSSSGSGQTGTNTGITNDINPVTVKRPPATSPASSPTTDPGR